MKNKDFLLGFPSKDQMKRKEWNVKNKTKKVYFAERKFQLISKVKGNVTFFQIIITAFKLTNIFLVQFSVNGTVFENPSYFTKMPFYVQRH